MQLLRGDMVNAFPFTLHLKVRIGRKNLHLASGIARKRIIFLKNIIQNGRTNILDLRKKDIAAITLRSNRLEIENFEFGMNRN